MLLLLQVQTSNTSGEKQHAQSRLLFNDTPQQFDLDHRFSKSLNSTGGIILSKYITSFGVLIIVMEKTI